jgi:hypothetical protein
VKGRVTGAATLLLIGSMIGTEDGRGVIHGFVDGLSQVVDQNREPAVKTVQELGNAAKDAAPDSAVAPPPEAVITPTTAVAGLGR